MVPSIGFIGFGEAGSTIAKGLRSAGADRLQAFDINRDSPRLGPRMRQRAAESQTTLVSSSEELAGAALIALAGTLSATTYLPVAGVALVLGIHRFMGEAMAATNLVGNGVAAIVIGKWCGQVDEERLAIMNVSRETRSPRRVAVRNF